MWNINNVKTNSHIIYFLLVFIPWPKLKLRLTNNYFSTELSDQNPKDHLKIQDAA